MPRAYRSTASATSARRPGAVATDESRIQRLKIHPLDGVEDELREVIPRPTSRTGSAAKPTLLRSHGTKF